MTVLIKVNTQGAREDFRKGGLTLIGAGVTAFLVGGDKVTSLEALLMLICGTVSWLIGIVERAKQADAAQEER